MENKKLYVITFWGEDDNSFIYELTDKEYDLLKKLFVYGENLKVLSYEGYAEIVEYNKNVDYSKQAKIIKNLDKYESEENTKEMLDKEVEV